MLATELANREASKRARLMRQARFPVPKSLDGYDFANVRLPDGYTKMNLVVEVRTQSEVTTIMNKLNQVQGVYQVSRVSG